MIKVINKNIKSAFILGSTSTVAKSVAIELAKQGCKRFHLLARNLEKNKALKKELNDKFKVVITEEKINFCIVGEPTNPKKLGEMIKIGRRGSLSGKIEITGTQGHIAYPHLSNNPINTLVAVCKKLKEKKLDEGTNNFQPSNLEFTSINVDNKAHNVIPSRARARFNIRYNNLHTSASLKKKIS